jgi:hypothetical protein
MHFKLLAAVTAVVALSVATTSAKADIYQLTVVDIGTQGGKPFDNVATFTLQESPQVSANGTGFFIRAEPVSIVSNGSKTTESATILFGAASNGTEFISDGQFFTDTLTGITTPFFSGQPSTPTFNLGTFGTGNQTLTITDISAAVPEASTWAMMLLGFVGLGFMGYRKKAGLRLA